MNVHATNKGGSNRIRRLATGHTGRQDREAGSRDGMKAPASSIEDTMNAIGDFRPDMSREARNGARSAKGFAHEGDPKNGIINRHTGLPTTVDFK
jgi:hypothetical protein